MQPWAEKNFTRKYSLLLIPKGQLPDKPCRTVMTWDPLSKERQRSVCYLLLAFCTLLMEVCLMEPSCPNSSGYSKWSFLSIAREGKTCWVSRLVFQGSLTLVGGARASLRALVWQRPYWSLTFTSGRLSWREATAAESRPLRWARGWNDGSRGGFYAPNLGRCINWVWCSVSFLDLSYSWAGVHWFSGNKEPLNSETVLI